MWTLRSKARTGCRTAPVAKSTTDVDMGKQESAGFSGDSVASEAHLSYLSGKTVTKGSA